MKIDISFGNVLLKDGKKNLQPDQILQLKYWDTEEISSSDDLLSRGDVKQTLPKIVSFFDKENIKYSLSLNCKKILDEISTENESIKKAMTAGSDFKKGQISHKDWDEFAQFMGSALKRPLKPHQLKASYHLALVKNGANFSVPGSGKTTVVLSVFNLLRDKGIVNSLFVVGPPSSFAAWQEEFYKVFGIKPNVKIFAGGNQRKRKGSYYIKSKKTVDIYLTTFQTLLQDTDEVNLLFKNLNKKLLLVIDEAHYIKQIEGKWASAVLNISKNATRRCVLTGTPAPKSYSDLFNLFDFLWPEQKLLSSREKYELKQFEENGDYESAGKILKPKVGALSYRVRKSELGLKVPVYKPTHFIRMNKYEKQIYELISKNIKDLSIKDYTINADLAVSLKRGRMMRLRQAVSYPKLLLSGIPGYQENVLGGSNDLKSVIANYDELETPAKVIELVNLTQKYLNENKKVLIWSNFLGTIDLLLRKFNDLGVHSDKITGAVPIETETLSEARTREKIRKEFLDPTSGLNVLIANPAACAESISLHTTCHNAIYYDLSYNCAQYLQSLDRIHRVGASEKFETYYDFLEYKGTIEGKIKENLKRKSEKMSMIIDEDYSIYSLDMLQDDDEAEIYNSLFAKGKE